MSRIAATFDRMRAEHRAGLVTYVTAGDPSLGADRRHPARPRPRGRRRDRGGRAVLGSAGRRPGDPARVRARARGRRDARGASSISSTRSGRRCARPSSCSPTRIRSTGWASSAFAARAAAAGVDGVLALDIPVEEAGAAPGRAARARGLDPIYLLSPTTTPERMRQAGELGRGFLYLISRRASPARARAWPTGLPDMVGRVTGA